MNIHTERQMIQKRIISYRHRRRGRLPKPTIRERSKGFTHRSLLLVRVEVGAGTVLRAPISPLTVLLRRVDSAEEDGEQFIVLHLGRVVEYLL